MANPNAFYEPEQDELLNELSVPTFAGQTDAAAGYEVDTEEEQYRFQQALQQQEEAQLAALEQVPEDVKRVSCWNAGSRGTG
jgi:translation initiation factor 3 subunit L